MPFSANDFLFGFALPALFGGVAFAACSRRSPEGGGTRFGPSLALIGGFLTGYFSLALGPLEPNAHWHWLPYVLVLPLITGPVSQAPGVTLVEQVLLSGLVAGIAGWLLIPTWEDLEPSRVTYLVFWTASVVVLAGLLEPLFQRFSGPFLPLVLSLTLIGGAVILALSGSLRFAQIVAAGAGALAGLAAASRFGGPVPPCNGMAIGFVLLLGGTLLVGRVNSFSGVPLAAYLLIPLAPLSLGLGVVGPLSRLAGPKRAVALASLPLSICTIAIGLAIAGES